MTTSEDFVAFLQARLKEEASLALAASPGPWHLNAEEDEVLAVDDVPVAEAFALSGQQLRATARHIRAHHPERVLADIDAKRRLLDMHAPEPGQHPDFCRHDRHKLPCPTQRWLAAPYSEHPDYVQKWRP